MNSWSSYEFLSILKHCWSAQPPKEPTFEEEKQTLPFDK